jgi:hypothetical protein
VVDDIEMQPVRKHFGYESPFASDDDELDFIRFNTVSGGESRSGQLTGTKALMLAVLEDGIRCYLGRAKLAADEAECWISSQRRYSPFSFIVVCETLGLDPQAVRLTVRRMRDEHVSPRSALPRTRNNVRVPGRVRLRIRRRGRAANGKAHGPHGHHSGQS